MVGVEKRINVICSCVEPQNKYCSLNSKPGPFYNERFFSNTYLIFYSRKKYLGEHEFICIQCGVLWNLKVKYYTSKTNNKILQQNSKLDINCEIYESTLKTVFQQM